MSRVGKSDAVLQAQLPNNLSSTQVASLLAGRIVDAAGGFQPAIYGLNGAQGSGKSTIAQLTRDLLLQGHGITAVHLSLDDFYLAKPERERLAREVHPLCAARGVPGTHDLPRMSATLMRLRKASPADRTPLPRFDKLADDCEPGEAWTIFKGRPDAIILEGWCVGLTRTDVPVWTGPINALEEEWDPEGKWFAWSLSSLAEYEPVWDELDLLASIEVPDLPTVIDSRLRQEEGLSSLSGRPKMERAAIVRFVEHFERYTRALWAAMPQRADMLFRRDRDFGFTLVKESS